MHHLHHCLLTAKSPFPPYLRPSRLYLPSQAPPDCSAVGGQEGARDWSAKDRSAGRGPVGGRGAASQAFVFRASVRAQDGAAFQGILSGVTAPLPLSSVSWVRRRRRRRAYGSGRGRVPSGGHGAALLPGLLHGDKAVRSFSSSKNFQYLKFIGSVWVLARGGLVVGGLGLLAIQAPLWWQVRGTGAWDKGEHWLGSLGLVVVGGRVLNWLRNGSLLKDSAVWVLSRVHCLQKAWGVGGPGVGW